MLSIYLLICQLRRVGVQTCVLISSHTLSLSCIYQIPSVKPTSRLAAVDLDWEQITASDIFLALSAFTPKGSRHFIKSVTIYLSKYGKERMEKDDVTGPSIHDDMSEEEDFGTDGAMDVRLPSISLLIFLELV